MIPLFVVDAFTDQPFAGNPAAVCVLDRWPADEWLQLVGREMNLSETAFLVRREGNEFDLRWFTPTVEVALCGHATLASAHALWEIGRARRTRDRLPHPKSGRLTATPLADGEIELDFPAKPATPCEPPPRAARRTRSPHRSEVGRNEFDYLVELRTKPRSARSRPDFGSSRQPSAAA